MSNNARGEMLLLKAMGITYNSNRLGQDRGTVKVSSRGLPDGSLMCRKRILTPQVQ